MYNVINLHTLASTTTIPFHISPLLGALIGIVAALMLVAIIIVIVIRFRNCGSEHELKAHDDEGLSLSATQCTANSADKTNNEPSMDLNGSVESLEEKNPDIIPQNNADEYYQDDKHTFVMLNSVPERNYPRAPVPVLIGVGQKVS